LKLTTKGRSVALALLPLAEQNGALPPKSQTGPFLANKHDLISVVPTSPAPKRNGWGGARNRASRVSTALTEKQVKDTFAAAERAVAIGLPFNRFVTIHLEALGFTDAKAGKAINRYLKLVGDYLTRRGRRTAWRYVRENDEGDKRKGSHVHIYLHWPDGLSFGRMQRKWVRALAGKRPPRRAVRTRRIGGSASAWRAAPDVYRVNLRRVLSYGLKGAPAAVAALYQLDRHEEGGRIIGKRCGQSQNLGGGALK
jgi:hypothetical protein